MNRDTFIKQAVSLGYVGKAEAVKWCKENPKSDYTEDDFIELYRHFDVFKHGETIPQGVWRQRNGYKTTKWYKNIGNDKWGV